MSTSMAKRLTPAHGKQVADIKKDVGELILLGYDLYSIAGLINLIHTESLCRVDAPSADVRDNKLFVDGHLVSETLHKPNT